MTRVPVQPHMLRWARERADADAAALAKRFPDLEEWERGERQPTLKQLESFAHATRTPIGFLFLPQPPVEEVPIPDFRTAAGTGVGRASPDLLDTIYLCQQRQDWYRDFARASGEPRRAFVGSASVHDDVIGTAADMREALTLDLEERKRLPSWTEALRRLLQQADEHGVLVMVSGVVGSNTHRTLDPQQFRGFALADDYAPLAFVNGADTKAAQMFTLAHELAHLWLGESGVSDAEALAAPDHAIERWCNQVAAELLAPLDAVREAYQPGNELRDEAQRLARTFKVSTLVVLRRIFDAGLVPRPTYWQAYGEELERLLALPRSAGGGNFYRTLTARTGRTFARALVVSVLEGHTSFTEAFRLLGVKKMATFHELGHQLGVTG